MTDQPNDDLRQDDLVPLFIPKLALLLEHAEKEKGAPLSEAEVLGIRDDAAVMMVPVSVAEQMATSRGADIDPENVWEEWQRSRSALKKSFHTA